MYTVIETQLTRPGTTNKPKIQSFKADLIVDFDDGKIGVEHLDAWRAQLTAWQLSPNQSVYVTESASVFCSARLAWLLLNSGFDKLSLVSEEVAKTFIDGSQRVFEPSMLDALTLSGFVAKKAMLRAWQNKAQIVDVRSAARFTGREAEPRAGVRSGHIPESINIHYDRFLSENKTEVFLSKAQLIALFEEHKIDLSKPLIFSCGSGVTACIGAFAAHLAGCLDVLVYDGSWAEWGSDHTLPCAVSN